MKKLVNGETVLVDNMRIFELGLEGLALSSDKTGKGFDTTYLSTIYGMTTDLITKCICLACEYNSLYSKVLKLLPFPLYAVETSIKYAVIGNIMRNKLDVRHKMLVASNALYISITDATYLKLCRGAWSIEQKPECDTRGIDIDEYKDDECYADFAWALRMLNNSKSCKTYYRAFMPDFVKACLSDDMILKWELEHILDFEDIPKPIKLQDNRILDQRSGFKYFMSLEYDTKAEQSNSGQTYMHTQQPKYNYKVYEEALLDREHLYGIKVPIGIQEVASSEANTPKSIYAAYDALYDVLTSRNDGISVNDISYSGVIVADKMLFTARNVLYMADMNNYSGYTVIGLGFDIVSFNDRIVYLKQTSRCESGAYKTTVYALDLLKNETRVCRVTYSPTYE